jgi:chromodomain-helicase-DNA-binding protein 4
MQAGKKKLVLDHLIVQKMDDDDAAGDDVQSILTFGAKALFEEGDQGAHDIICTFFNAGVVDCLKFSPRYGS